MVGSQRALAESQVDAEIHHWIDGLPYNADGNRAYPDLPIATNLKHAGLSDRDAREAALEIDRQARLQCRALVLHDPALVKRYNSDLRWREQLNRRIIERLIGKFCFSLSELERMDQGFQLGLVPKDPKPPTAHVIDVDGREYDFSIDLAADDKSESIVTNETTGEITVVPPA